KLKRVGRHFRKRDVVPGLVVEDRFQPGHRAHAHVIVRAGDDELIGLDVLVEHELPGIRTFDPQIFRRFPPQDVADLRSDDIGEPVHASLRSAINRGSPKIYGGARTTRQAAVRKAVSPTIMAYSAACFAPRTPCASADARSATAATVFAVPR